MNALLIMERGVMNENTIIAGMEVEEAMEVAIVEEATLGSTRL